MPRHSDATKTAIKNAVDIVALVGEYLPLRRAGSKYKALCPFHDDHNPSLELNPERQSFKCWSCGAGGDVFDFVKNYEHVDFPEALRMLADRAGIVLESPAAGITARRLRGPRRPTCSPCMAWAERRLRRALPRVGTGPGLRARPGPDGREHRAVSSWLCAAGARLAAGRGAEARVLRRNCWNRPDWSPGRKSSPGQTRERFRGRLIFPIHDERGRPIGFGGRILPEVERAMAAQGKNVAKYLNSPETAPVSETQGSLRG